MIMLDLADLLRIAGRVIGPDFAVRDFGLLDSAAARPRATVFGADAYPGIHEKAAALLQSVVSNHGLIDGQKRLGLAAVIIFYGVNGYRLTVDNDGAYDLIMAIASGVLNDVQQIATRLTDSVAPTGSLTRAPDTGGGPPTPVARLTERSERSIGGPGRSASGIRRQTPPDAPLNLGRCENAHSDVSSLLTDVSALVR